MNFPDDDDDDYTGGLYENGNWFWDEIKNQLMFKSELSEVQVERSIATTILGAVEFREDIDLNEQQRFRKRMQRKTCEKNDVVTLQDVKDVVLFTAPAKVAQPIVINLLHLPATERLLRALIFFCQYHLQISDVMDLRQLELLTKIRTPNSEKTEMEFRENLEDLRLLVAKEYANMIMGFGKFAKYHHMGTLKKLRSLSKKESLLFETFIRISIQIIWIALGRKSFRQIEIEVHRIFKSTIYNSADHKLNRDPRNKTNVISPSEKTVLLGHCLRKKQKVNVLSPLMNEVHCNRFIDHRIYGLGIIKYPSLSARHRYMENAISLPEKLLENVDMSVGILGLPRGNFDILLKEIKFTSASSSNVSVIKPGAAKPANITKSTTTRKSIMVSGPLYKDIVLPPKEKDNIIDESLLTGFPSESTPIRTCNEDQRQKWLQRFLHLAAKHKLHHGRPSQIPINGSERDLNT